MLAGNRFHASAIAAGAWAIAVTVLTLAVVDSATAQDAAVTADLLKELTKLRTEVNSMLRSGAITDEPKFARYYDLTLTIIKSPGQAHNLHKVRSQIKREARTASSGTAAHTALNALLLDKMAALASGKDNPAARTNAMLILSDLNSRELNSAGVGTEVPLPAALPALVSAFGQKDQSDGVRVAALLGILRHAEAGIADPNAQERILKGMLRIAADKDPPPGRSSDAHHWIRRRAVETLGALKSAGDGENEVAVVESLLKIVDEPEATLGLRCEAARALGRLPLNAAAGLNYSRIAQSLGNLAVNIAQSEKSRQGLKFYMHSVQTTLQGPAYGDRPARGETPVKAGLTAAAEQTAHKEFVDGLIAELAPIMNLIDSEKVEDADLPEKMVAASDDLADWMEENPVAEQEVLAAR